MENISTKQRVENIALKHFASYGYNNISLEHIAKECNITKPTIYYYFKSKENLYKSIFYNYLSNLVNSLNSSLQNSKQNPQNRLEIYIEVFGQYLIDNPFFGSLFFREIAGGTKNISKNCKRELSKSLSTLNSILQDGVHQDIFVDENPFMIQLMIVSTLATYNITTPLREEVSSLLLFENKKSFQAEFTTIISSLKKIVIKGLQKWKKLSYYFQYY